MNRLIYLLIAITLLSITSMTNVSADQTVKTVEVPIGFVAQSTPNQDYITTLNINPPDRIDEIISFELLLQGDFQSNTGIVGKVRKTGGSQTFDCNPSTWTTPNVDAPNYMLSFDCSSLANQFDFTTGKIDAGFRTDKIAQNLKGHVRMTYYNKPKGDVGVFGTEYEVGDSATIFLQLKDNQGLPVNDGACVMDVYYPNQPNITHSSYLTSAPMIHLNGSDGLYYYDISVLPNITGVYMISATCSYTFQQFDIHPAGSIYSSERDDILGTHTGDTQVLNDPADYLYTFCGSSGGGTKTCSANYTWDISPYGINQSEITSIFYNFLGETSTAGVVTTMYAWNWSSGSWYTLPNTVTMSGLAKSGFPTGINDYLGNSILDSPQDFINASGSIKLQLEMTSGTNFDVYSNWLALSLQTETGVIIDVKGSGEMHVESHFGDLNQSIIDYINTSVGNLNNLSAEDIWTYPTRTLTDYNFTEILDYLYSINATVVDIQDKCEDLNVSVQEIRDFQVNELSNNLTEFGLYFDYINDTTLRTETYILGLTNLTAEEVWTYYNRTLTDYNQSELINLIFGLNTSIHNLENLTAEQVWTYYNRTLTDIQFNVSIDETAILQAIQNANSSIIQAISDHNQSISDLLYSINTTINDRLDDIEDDVNNLANTTTQNIWEYFNRTLTEFDFTVEINDTEILLAISDLNTTINTRIDGTDSYILGLDNLTAQEVWSFYNRTLTDFSFTVEINNTEILLAIEDSNSSIIDRINLSETNIMNQMDAHNSTIMNKLYGIQGEIAGLENLSAEGVWSYVNRTLTDFQFTVNINETNLLNFLDGMNTSINDNQEIIIADLLNNTDITYDIYSLILNLTLGNVSVQADVDWQEGELVLYNMSSPIQQYANVVSFQSQQSELTVTTQVCKDSSTLEHIVNSTRCFLDQCFESSYSTFQICEFGCKNNMCVPAPWTAILIAMFVALGIVVAIWYLTRDKIDRGRGLL